MTKTGNPLTITPLGGLGEIGRNMTLFEINNRHLIVDCGVLFPEEQHPGIDLILPDISQAIKNIDTIEAVILTHGHEDHIGAIPYLLKHKPNIPIVGTKLTLALTEAKLVEHHITPNLHEVKQGQTKTYGPYSLEFIAVNHSIPDALAIAIRTTAGLCLHTGDFKMDQLPLDGRITDLRAFAKLGEQGVDLLLIDSTNADIPGFIPTEKNIGPTLQQIIAKATGKIIVASFASHIHRVQQVLTAAANNNRKVVLLGRSMIRNMTIAEKLGYLQTPPQTVISEKEAANHPENKLIYMSTGSQGEPMAALSRMANNEHKIVITQNDTIILASSLIPGNETSVYRIINKLTKQGANVIHKGNAKVHVSGHAAAGELLYCYNIIQPKNVLPVHGEQRHLVANAKLAAETGIPQQNIVIAENGTQIQLENGIAKKIGQIQTQQIYVDGKSVGTITEEDLQERLTLAKEGFISITTVVETSLGNIIHGPEIHAKGIAENQETLNKLTPQIAKQLETAMREGVTSQHQLQQIVRRTVGRHLATKLRRRAMIIPIIVVI